MESSRLTTVCFVCIFVQSPWLEFCLLVGRIDPSVHELEMVFKEVGINPKEMLDYTKSIDPIAISQPVSRFPAESTDKVELLIPVLDDEGKLSAPSVTFADEVDKGDP